MARDTIAFLEAVVGGPAHLVGWSAGASVALHVVLRRPDLVRRTVLMAGVFHREGWIPEAIDPDAGPPEVSECGYAELSPDGPDRHPVVAAKLTRMNWEEPTLAASVLRGVRSRTLVMLGDDDEVTLEHAVATYRALPDAELAVVPGTSHGLLHEKPALCYSILVSLLTTDPVPTIAPVRRKSEGCDIGATAGGDGRPGLPGLAHNAQPRALLILHPAQPVSTAPRWLSDRPASSADAGRAMGSGPTGAGRCFRRGQAARCSGTDTPIVLDASA